VRKAAGCSSLAIQRQLRHCSLAPFPEAMQADNSSLAVRSQFKLDAISLASCHLSFIACPTSKYAGATFWPKIAALNNRVARDWRLFNSLEKTAPKLKNSAVKMPLAKSQQNYYAVKRRSFAALVHRIRDCP
jgi:hypothetical protein